MGDPSRAVATSCVRFARVSALLLILDRAKADREDDSCSNR